MKIIKKILSFIILLPITYLMLAFFSATFAALAIWDISVYKDVLFFWEAPSSPYVPIARGVFWFIAFCFTIAKE